MEATSKNEKTARAIINVLAEGNYTITEATAILHFVSGKVHNLATVQKVDLELFETESNPS